MQPPVSSSNATDVHVAPAAFDANRQSPRSEASDVGAAAARENARHRHKSSCWDFLRPYYNSFVGSCRRCFDKDTNGFEEVTAFVHRHLNFFRVHLLYFFTVSFFVGCIVFAIEQQNPKQTLGFVDALFMAFSASKKIYIQRFLLDCSPTILIVLVVAVCVTGLTTQQFASLRLSSQLLIFTLILMGGVVTMTWVVLMVRRHFMRQEYDRMKRKLPSHPDVEDNIEYLALGKLATIVVFYYVVNFLFVFLVLGIYCSYNQKTIDILRNDGSLQPESINPWWFSAFHAVSALANGTCLYECRVSGLRTLV